MEMAEASWREPPTPRTHAGRTYREFFRILLAVSASAAEPRPPCNRSSKAGCSLPPTRLRPAEDKEAHASDSDKRKSQPPDQAVHRRMRNRRPRWRILPTSQAA